MVVDLSFGIADDGLRAPHIVVLSALAAAVDAGSVGVGDAAHGYGELCGVVGEQQVTAVGGERLQGVDHLVGSQSAGQVLPALVNTDAVAHHPAGCLLFDVQLVDGGRSKEHTLVGVHVVLLEPGHGIFLVVGGGVVVSHEHGHLRAALLHFVGNVEAHGLSFRDAAVGVAGFHGVGHIDVRGSLLDEIGVHHFVDIGDVLIVLNDLHARLPLHGGVGPVEGDLTAALLIVGHEIADAFAVGGVQEVHVGAGREGNNQ